MNINEQLKDIIKLEVLNKKALDSAKEQAKLQRPITRRSIELIQEEKRLMELIELECEL